MSGWIKIDKDLSESLRFQRVVRKLRASSNALRGVTSHVTANTIVLGALVRLWMHADTHIQNDDILEATTDEIDELVGVDGFAAALPADWLQVVDADHVKLPDFLAHNGGSARERKQNAKRQAAYRSRKQARNVTESNALRDEPRLDQTRPEETRPEKNPSASSPPTRAPKPLTVPRETDPEWFLDFKLAYPERAGDQGWRKAQRAANERIREGHTPAEFIAGAQRYAEFCRLTGKIGTEYTKQAKTFLGPDKPFLQPWTPPASKADTRLAGNISAAEEFLRRTEVTQ